MSQEERQDAATYRVVVDHEKQYTVCPVERAIPRGSREAGKQGSIMECLAYIEQAWALPIHRERHIQPGIPVQREAGT
ncbi:MbtH family protein [Sorangium sp. So ce1014]|uniref:MbtH family protein n=1 Tax=unclassified Sorangium TaxID=2621164 RepID=UPI003F6400B7